MPPIPATDFDFYLTLSMKISGVGVGAWAIFSKLDYLKSFWNVARGQGDDLDRTIAREGLLEAGVEGFQVMRHVINRAARQGHQDIANNLRALQAEVNSTREDSTREEVNSTREEVNSTREEGN